MTWLLYGSHSLTKDCNSLSGLCTHFSKPHSNLLVLLHYLKTSLQFPLSSITPSFLPTFTSQLLLQENDETFNFRF
ncbi:hypothetical protein P8452_19089 [Trifolium repens]|nr:hypothetical protein P8452_19089 [Trifolium repens]